MQNRSGIRSLLLWLGTTFLITFNFPAPTVHSNAFSQTSAAYAQYPSLKNFERLCIEQRKVEDRRAWLLLAHWIACFGLGWAVFAIGKDVARRYRV